MKSKTDQSHEQLSENAELKSYSEISHQVMNDSLVAPISDFELF